ncbi:MAG: squalene--hopene cyclase [Planctomycetota bacterium]|nr:MAG: squalene--hopene cyclase [Planctomycetota bacterium]
MCVNDRFSRNESGDEAMNPQHFAATACLAVTTTLNSLCAAEPAPTEPVTLSNVVDPGANEATEPIADEFSMNRAVHFLDSASLNWQKERQCFTCHTNYSYLYARPLVSADDESHQTVRSFAEELVATRWPEKGPRWDAEVVATAAALAFNDAHTTGQLDPLTRAALDRMWTLQREDGGWSWLDCDWPPMESDDDYGVTLAALAVAVAPDDYAKTEQARRGLAGIQKYLAGNPPPTLHHQAMLLWAGSYLPELFSEEDRNQCVRQLSALQHADGGWSLSSLGDWQREDGTPQNVDQSDGYGTGFVLYILRRAGVEPDDERILRGIAWLKQNQRESGRWFTRSLKTDSEHFITHAGTAFAVMALIDCAPQVAHDE